jgi:hypothetical protein
MKIAIAIKNNKLSSYPADLLIDGEIIKSYNLIFELTSKKVNFLIAKSLPSQLIKELREVNITFLKVNSLDELEDLELIPLSSYEKIKRGAGCQSKFN